MPKKDCVLCGGTGIYKQPKDDAKFEKTFDKYMDSGFMNGNQAYTKAINEVGYTKEVCECCNDDKTE